VSAAATGAAATGAATGTAAASMRGIARGGSANLAGAVVTAAANFALTIAVTRGLSKASAGVFFSTTSLFMIATVVGQLGANTGLVYFLPRARTLGRPELMAGYVRAAVRPVLLVAVAMAGTTYWLAPHLAGVVSPDHVGGATTYLRVLALFVPVAGLGNIALAGTRGLGTMRPNALVELVCRPLVQVVAVAVVVALAADDLIGWAWALPYLPATALAWWWWRTLARRAGVHAHPRGPSQGREFWSFSGPRALTSVVQVVMQRLDIVLVGALAGAVAAAVYAAATRFIVAGQMGTNAISLAAQPRLAEALARRDHDAVQHIYQTSTAWLMAVTWPLYLVFTVFGEQLLTVFGKGYDVGAPVLVLLSTSMIISTGFGMVDMVLAMAGHTSWNLANALLALVVQIGLDLWLIPTHGVLGAAIGWSAAIVVRNVAALTQVALALRLHPFGRTTATSAAIAFVAFAVVPTLARLALGTSWGSLLGSLAVGGLLYLAGLRRFQGTLQLTALRSVRRTRSAGP
jgi:O-antigen/teichoic acid export membrane protein